MATGSPGAVGAGRVSLANVPVLAVRGDDVTGSYGLWKNKLGLFLRLKEVECDGKLPENLRMLILLTAVGDEGLSLLNSRGIDPLDQSLEYSEVMAVLDEHFCRESSLFLSVQKFVSVSQVLGESYRDYLVRVEKLSRKCNFVKYNAEVLRQEFCLVMAVNGIRDKNLRVVLMSMQDLNWEKLRQILLSVHVAADAVAEMEGTHQVSRVKSEAVGPKRRNSEGELRPMWSRKNRRQNSKSREWSRGSSTESDSEDECYNCGSSSHKIATCPSVRCYGCSRRGHLAGNCPYRRKPHFLGAHASKREVGPASEPSWFRVWGWAEMKSPKPAHQRPVGRCDSKESLCREFKEPLGRFSLEEAGESVKKALNQGVGGEFLRREERREPLRRSKRSIRPARDPDYHYY